MNDRALHLDPAATAKLIRRVRTQRQADPAGFLAWLNHLDPLAPDRTPPLTRREHFLACGVPACELAVTSSVVASPNDPDAATASHVL